jgi:predicted RNA-binding Zn ribbon-like protein
MSDSGPATPASITSLLLVGGHTALDFVNTVARRLTAEPVDFLADFDALISWGRYAGVLAESERHACTLAAARAGSANSTFRRALLLREALYDLFTARAQGQPLAPVSLEALNREIVRGASAWRLTCDEHRAWWRWPPDDAALVLARVAASAAAILTDDTMPRLGRCAGTGRGCAWLFLDTSPGGTRRWCSMQACGNRAKARAHYRRAHGA